MKGPSRLRPSPAMVVACISLAVAMSGFAWAATRIGTGDLKNGAVTAKKIHTDAVRGIKIRDGAVAGYKIRDAAVTSEKIADGAIATEKLAGEARGVALGGVRVDSNGALLTWFNRRGGQPVVDHGRTGEYVVQFPGFSEYDTSTAITVATIESGPGGEIVTRVGVPSGGSPYLRVLTSDSAGNAADRSFFYTAYGANST